MSSMASAISPPDPTGSRASSNSPDEIPSFQSDLSTARKELQQIATYLNVLMVAYNRAHGSPLSRHEQVVDRVGGKLLTSLAFYRNSARKLAIHCRTAQESQQSAHSCPSAAYSKLQRMRSELELLRVAVGKLVPQDYSVFNDLKLVSVEEARKLKPEHFAEAHRFSETDLHHRTFCAQIEYEQERRKKVMQEIDGLVKKKKSLQEDVKKRKDSLVAVTDDIDKDGKALLDKIAQKFNITPADINKDISDAGPTILEAVSALQQQQREETPLVPTTADADVEMAEIPETPIVTPDAPSNDSLEDVIAREEGEASDEGETCTSPTA